MILSIDIGTTAIKAGVFSVGGKQLGTAYLEYPLIHPERWHVEQDAGLWWDLSCQTARKALRRANVNAGEVVALSISAQGISFVPVDKRGQPLHNAFSWLDTRSMDQANELNQLFPSQAESFRRFGIHAISTYTLPKIMWLKENLPKIFDQAFKFSTCLDFINKRLLDRFMTDYSIAGGTLMHDLTALSWADDLLEAVGIPIEKLPSIDWAGTLLGSIQPKAAKELGLPNTVQVVLGGHDQECAAIGAGLRKGEVTISLGTASILVTATKEIISDPDMRIPCYPHVIKEQFVLEAVISTAGVAFRWLRDLFNSVASVAYGSQYDHLALDTMAKSVPPGANGALFFPHLSGATSPFWDPNASGVLYGITLATTPSHIVRAVLEGWCYQLKSNLLIIEELTSQREATIVFGGGTRSSFLRQLLADVLGRPILIPAASETALQGAAILAGLGIGEFSNLEEAATQIRKEAIEIEPNPRNVDAYAEHYPHYRAIEDLLISSERAKAL